MPRAALALAVLLAACGGPLPVTPQPAIQTVTPPSAPSGDGATGIGQPVPAPGSESDLYPPNPGAIVVAIDPGHGGCLDWGVPSPHHNTVPKAEKTMTLGIARLLRDRLEAEGVRVIMTRDGDVALAGDDYPELGCDGPPFREVNGDGVAGFGPGLPEGTLARDELQARLDLANAARADVLVSIHVNSPFDAGRTVEIAYTETFYTDETPWGASLTEELAEQIQAGVVDAFGAAEYERGDRGITAHNFYLVAPPLFDPTPERPNPLRQPTRGALMPAVLSEVGSITLEAEAELLASQSGQATVADGLYDGLRAFFASRTTAARIDPLTDGGALDEVTAARPGDGPPFWAPAVPAAAEDGQWRLPLRLTNTGTEAWPDRLHLVVGWGASDEPYLAAPPPSLTPLEAVIPALQPGESVDLEVELPSPGAGRRVAWLTLASGDLTFAARGSAPLQLATERP